MSLYKPVSRNEKKFYPSTPPKRGLNSRKSIENVGSKVRKRRNLQEDSQIDANNEISKKKVKKSGGNILAVHEGVFKGFDVKCLCSIGPQLWIAGKGKIAIFNTKTVHYLTDLTFKPSDNLITKICVVDGVGRKSKKTVWAGHESGKVTVWDVKSRRLICSIPTAHRKKIMDIIQVGSRVWTCSVDTSIRIWDIRSRNPLYEVYDHELAVHALCYVPQTRTVWSGGKEHYLKFRNATNGELKPLKGRVGEGICQIKYTNGYVWITGDQGGVHVFNGINHTRLKYIPLKDYRSPFHALEVTTEEVWCLGYDRVMRLFNVATQSAVKNILATNTEVWITGFIPVENNQVWANCSDGYFRIWSTLGEKVKISSSSSSSSSSSNIGISDSDDSENEKEKKSGGGGGGSSSSSKKNMKKVKSKLKSKVRTRRKSGKSSLHRRVVSDVRMKKKKKAPMSSTYSAKGVRSPKGRKRKKSISKEPFPIYDSENVNEYQRQILILRSQLSGASGMNDKLQDRLKHRRGQLKENDVVLEDISKKFDDAKGKIEKLSVDGVENSRENNLLKDRIEKLERERKDFIDDMTKEMNLPPKETTDITDIAKAVRRAMMKNETLKKELQYSKQDLLNHIQQLKQIHLNFVKMQTELVKKERHISSLNKIVVETTNKDSDSKIATLLNSLSETNKEIESVKADKERLTNENMLNNNNISSILDQVQIISDYLNIKGRLGDEKKTKIERIKGLLVGIEKNVVSFTKGNGDNKVVKSMLQELRSYMKKDEI